MPHFSKFTRKHFPFLFVCFIYCNNAFAFGLWANAQAGYESFTFQASAKKENQSPFNGVGYQLGLGALPFHISHFGFFAELAVSGVNLQSTASGEELSVQSKFTSYLGGLNLGVLTQISQNFQVSILSGFDYSFANTLKLKSSGVGTEVETQVKVHSRINAGLRASYEIFNNMFGLSLTTLYRAGCLRCKSSIGLETKRYSGFSVALGFSYLIDSEKPEPWFAMAKKNPPPSPKTRPSKLKQNPKSNQRLKNEKENSF
jgi:hypothetical protein